MKKEMFADLMGSAREALEHARGKRSLRTTTPPRPLAPLDGRAPRVRDWHTQRRAAAREHLKGTSRRLLAAARHNVGVGTQSVKTQRTLPQCCQDRGRFERTAEDTSGHIDNCKLMIRRSLSPEVPRHQPLRKSSF